MQHTCEESKKGERLRAKVSGHMAGDGAHLVESVAKRHSFLAARRSTNVKVEAFGSCVATTNLVVTNGHLEQQASNALRCGSCGEGCLSAYGSEARRGQNFVCCQECKLGTLNQRAVQIPKHASLAGWHSRSLLQYHPRARHYQPGHVKLTCPFTGADFF